MNHLLRSITVIAALAAGATALASEPVHEVAQAPAATTPTLAPATPAAPVTAAPQPAATPTAKNNAPVKVPTGYKVKVIDGETRFCRKDAPLGTRFPTEVCMTEAQYEEQERNRNSMRNALQDRQKSYKTNN